ncbi:probable glutamate receptor [Dermacentor andersoni]|uniref:probable glutamate receptor n=1 Tax=Dermacentor andersoni TaxID=34620 RepID=UPI002416F18F|nr:glutamate receptor-like [Dermacentor andersoni]
MTNISEPVLRITTINHVPHGQFFPNGSIHHITFASGLLKLLWDTAETLGVRHNTTILHNADWGVKLANGSWTGFLGELQRNESDVSFTLFYPTNSRNGVAQPTASVWTEDVVILGAFGNDTSQGSSIAASVEIFERDVQIMVGVSLLLLSLIVSLAPGSSKTFISRLVESVLMLSRSMCLQVNHEPPRSPSSRIVVATWWLAVLVFANVFNGKMKAGLTVRHKSGHRIDSAAQLASREDVRVYMLRGPAYPILLARPAFL